MLMIHSCTFPLSHNHKSLYDSTQLVQFNIKFFASNDGVTFDQDLQSHPALLFSSNKENQTHLS